MAAGVEAAAAAIPWDLCTEVESSEEEDDAQPQHEAEDAKLAQLAEMQFPVARAVRALQEAGGDVGLAVERLLAEDPEVLESSGEPGTCSVLQADADACPPTQRDPQEEAPAREGRKADDDFGRRHFLLQAAMYSGSPSEHDAEPFEDGQDVTLASVLADLRRVPAKHWRCQARKNVAPHDAKETQQMPLGLLLPRCFTHGIPMPSRASWIFPNLTRRLLQLRRCCLSEKEASRIQVTSIQVTRNMQARPHVDRGNVGMSDLVAVGDFAGGETWIEEDMGLHFGLRQQEETQTEDRARLASLDVHAVGEAVNRGRYKPGERLRGRVMNVHNRWLHFDANKLHFTMPFHGERYCIIFYAMKRQTHAPPVVRAFLQGLGFGFSNVLDPSAPSEQDMQIIASALKCQRVGGDAEVPRQPMAMASEPAAAETAPARAGAPGRKRPAPASRAALPPAVKAPRRSGPGGRRRGGRILETDADVLVGTWHLESAGRSFEIRRRVRSRSLFFRDGTDAERGFILEGELRKHELPEGTVWCAHLEKPSDSRHNDSEEVATIALGPEQALGAYVELRLLRDRKGLAGRRGLEVQETFCTEAAGEEPVQVVGIAQKETGDVARPPRHRFMRPRPARSEPKHLFEGMCIPVESYFSTPGPATSSSSGGPAPAPAAAAGAAKAVVSQEDRLALERLVGLGLSRKRAQEAVRSAEEAMRGGGCAASLALAVAEVLLRPPPPCRPPEPPAAEEMAAAAREVPEPPASPATPPPASPYSPARRRPLPWRRLAAAASAPTSAPAATPAGIAGAAPLSSRWPAVAASAGGTALWPAVAAAQPPRLRLTRLPWAAERLSPPRLPARRLPALQPPRPQWPAVAPPAAPLLALAPPAQPPTPPQSAVAPQPQSAAPQWPALRPPRSSGVEAMDPWAGPLAESFRRSGEADAARLRGAGEAPEGEGAEEEAAAWLGAAAASSEAAADNGVLEPPTPGSPVVELGTRSPEESALESPGGTASCPEAAADDGSLQLVGMGFSVQEAKSALESTGGSVELAVALICSAREDSQSSPLPVDEEDAGA